MFAARWGALPSVAPLDGAWRALYASRHALPRTVRLAATDVAVPLRRADALRRISALEDAHPTLCLRALQGLIRDDAPGWLRPAVSRAVRELAVVALARAGHATAPDASAEAALLLDIACAVSLLVDPTTDVDAVRAAVARLGAAAAARITRLGLNVPGMPTVAMCGVMAFLFPPPWPARGDGDEPLPSLLDPDTPLETGGGLDIGGARTRYYAARNSSLASVLATRAGLPITLSLLFVVVAAAAGVDVRPCGVPRQFMTRTPPGVIPERFFDVFEGCVMRSRAEMQTILASWGIVPSDALLGPTPPREVAARMVRNLLGTVGGGDDLIGRDAALPVLSAALALSHGGRDGDTDELRVARLQAAAAAGETRIAQHDFDELTAPSPGLPPVPEHFLAALRDILREAYSKADALSSHARPE